MTTGRLAALAVAATLLVATVGCGDGEQDYCTALAADQKVFSEMQDDPSGLGLLEHTDTLHRLADKAPDDLTDEWQTFLGAIDAFEQTLRATGVRADDFVDGKPPAGLSEADRTRVANAASELSSSDVVAAANGIEQQAKDVCKLQLGL